MQQAVDTLGFRFNAHEFDPSQGAGQLPVGVHKVQILTGALKATQKGDGGYLQLILQVLEGDYAGATGTVNLNLHNPSEKARKIAMEELSRICHVVGVYDIEVVSQIANIPFMVKVEKSKDDDRYTEVTKYFDINGEPPRKAGPTAAPQPQAQPQVSAAPFGGQVVSQPASQASPAPFGQPQQGYAPPGASGPAQPFGQPQGQPQAQTQWQQPQGQPFGQPQAQQAVNWDNAGAAGVPNPWAPPGQ